MNRLGRATWRNVLSGLLVAAVLASTAQTVFADCSASWSCGESGPTKKCSCPSGGSSECNSFSSPPPGAPQSCKGGGCYAWCDGDPSPDYDCCEAI